MSFFAEYARYLPGKKPELRGLAAIRAEFAPQFAGRFGAMTFDVYDRVFDEVERRATIRWACKLDLTGEHGQRATPLMRWFARARYGGHLQWHGLDVFRDHFPFMRPSFAGLATGSLLVAGDHDDSPRGHASGAGYQNRSSSRSRSSSAEAYFDEPGTYIRSALDLTPIGSNASARYKADNAAGKAW